MVKRSIRTLKPGLPGTKRWVVRYGDKLVKVRYIYSAKHKRRKTTVEIIVDETPWEPRRHDTPVNKIVHLAVKYGEVQIGRLIRSAGGRWNKAAGYWELPYREAVSLGLDKRIINH